MIDVDEQFARVKRWYIRYKEINDGINHTRESDYSEDIVYSFFQNCFHLRDWVINSGALSRKTVNAFIGSNTDMKICRDLCNGSKHLTINNPSIDKDTSISRHSYSLTFGDGPTKIEVVYWIHSGKYIVNAFDLATNCIVLWEAFLKNRKLIK